MKILIMIGDHPRHLHLYKTIKSNAFDCSAIIMRREKHLPIIPKKINYIDKINFKKHFIERSVVENEYFGKIRIPESEKKNIKFIEEKDLNTKNTLNIVKKINPKICIIFGTKIIKNPLLKVLPKKTINIHLGLSPEYKGSATLFWPFYFLEPQYAGVTIHKITNKVDSGDILHQILPKFSKSDGIHDVSCKLVKKACKDIVKLVKLSKKKNWIFFKQKKSGKLFLTKDFKVEHLRVIYNLFDNDIVRFFLKKKNKKYPKIIKAF